MMAENHKILWQKCLEIIKDNIPAIAFDAWFKPAESKEYTDGVVTLAIPSDFFREQYEERFYPILRRAMQRVYGPKVKLQYVLCVVKDDPESEVRIKEGDRAILQPASKQVVKPNPFSEITYEDIDSQLNPTYNFENYCLGESNKLAYTIAESIGNSPTNNNFNPFFLYGSTGVGKTHLIQAIGVRVKEKMPNARVLYITSRIFENQYGTAVREKRVNDFINFYQSIDVLLIDDIQELSSKLGTQNAFYPIFNDLHQKGKTLIMTSDRPPVELDGIMDRLINRFKWGVTAILPKPDLNLRKQILRQKSAKNGLSLPEDVISLIAENVTDSVRELEGVVISLITRATILNQPITTDLARIVIQYAVKTSKKKINFDMIVEATAAYYNIDPDVIFTKNRVRDIADARQIIMYLSNKHTELSSTSIGYKLARTHATVLHGIKTVENRMVVEKSMSEAIDSIEQALRR